MIGDPPCLAPAACGQSMRRTGTGEFAMLPPALHRSKTVARRAPVCGVQRFLAPHLLVRPIRYEGTDARGEFRRHYGKLARALCVRPL